MKSFETAKGILYQGDCLDIMKDIPDDSIDMILCDLPYGTTACEWDKIIDINLLWVYYKRIIKKEGAIVLFGVQPFTSSLIVSNLDMFRYEWIWNKKRPSNFQMMNFQPGRIHENILVFSHSKAVFCRNQQMKYFPIKTDLDSVRKVPAVNVYGNNHATLRNTFSEMGERELTGKLPKSIIEFTNAKTKDRLHPTQKPVVLFEYLIKTYTTEGMTVLDNCMGSGTTAVAAENTNRRWIGIEKEEEYFNVIKERLIEMNECNIMEFAS